MPSDKKKKSGSSGYDKEEKHGQHELVKDPGRTPGKAEGDRNIDDQDVGEPAREPGKTPGKAEGDRETVDEELERTRD